MTSPKRPVTLAELRRNDGSSGRPRYVSFEGMVYDVSDCPRWRHELHENLHFAGQDLTGELAEAPHSAEVFKRPCVKLVGKLADT